VDRASSIKSKELHIFIQGKHLVEPSALDEELLGEVIPIVNI
jgi:hypothetical protein